MCRGLAMDVSVLYPEPEFSAAAPVVAAPEPVVRTPAEPVAASSQPRRYPPRKSRGRTNRLIFPGAAGVPAPPRAAGEIISPRALPGAPWLGGYFAPG